MKPKILYISYDGMLEPLGQSQVLAYLEKLAADYEIRLISFEKKLDWMNAPRRRGVEVRIAAAGIHWLPLRYHKSPSGPATVFDIVAGTLAALYLVARHRIVVIHARSYVAAQMALTVKRLTGVRFLFDMRGFWADERVDAGIWPRGGRLYRLSKRLERSFLLRADHVVTLTAAAEAEITNFSYLADHAPPITVIPTCANLDRFSPRSTDREDAPTLGFVGTATSWSLVEQLLAFYRLLLKRIPGARLLIVNRDDHDYIRACIAEAEVDARGIELVRAEHGEVPALIARMTIGTALKRPSYSQLACAPTKLAEYLGCGVPVVANAGIGDVAGILEGEGVGIVLRGFADHDLKAGVDSLCKLLENDRLAERCRSAAQRLFSLEAGVGSYANIYRTLTSANAAAAREVWS
jgi:glycosyltransferase involved in cell wall biosynthesis